ncbi:MAG: HAD family hydrolase [Leucobacter sp.]
MLLLIDLDNTLVDRASAFNSWAHSFVEKLERPATDAIWLIKADRDGYESRESLAAMIKHQFVLEAAVPVLVDMLLYEHVDLMTLDAATAQALTLARDHGWRIAIVTNGATSQQHLKIQNVGLERYVDAVVISETVGVKKPEPRIFQIAADRLQTVLDGAWMIGDHPNADIGGAQAIGLNTAWVSRGDLWAEHSFSPTLIAPTSAEAINEIFLRNNAITE